MDRRQHLSVAQAASALEAVAAAANALARGSELPSLLQFTGMVQNHSAVPSPAALAPSGGGSSGGHGGLTQVLGHGGDGGLSELRTRLDTKPSVDAQHVAKSLEEAILRGSALLDEQFLVDIAANGGHLRDSLSYSAGSTPLLPTSAAAFLGASADQGVPGVPGVRHGDKTYPPWPAAAVAGNVGGVAVGSTATAVAVGSTAAKTTTEMHSHLRNLNVTIAALGLGLAVANDEDDEHSVRSYGAKVSDCEMKTQETLRHADQQNALMVLAAKSFFRRTAGNSDNDAVASLIPAKNTRRKEMDEQGIMNRSSDGEEGGTKREGWQTRRNKARQARRGGGGGGGSGGGSSGSSSGSSSSSSSSRSGFSATDLVQRVFEIQFLDLCHRDPEGASDILSEFSDKMVAHLSLPRLRYLRPIGHILGKC